MADVQLSTLGAVVKAAYEAEADTNAFTDAEKALVASALQDADVGDLAALDEITTGEVAASAYASQAEAEAGTENTKIMTALRVAQAITEQAGEGGGGGSGDLSELDTTWVPAVPDDEDHTVDDTSGADIIVVYTGTLTADRTVAIDLTALPGADLGRMAVVLHSASGDDGEDPPVDFTITVNDEADAEIVELQPGWGALIVILETGATLGQHFPITTGALAILDTIGAAHLTPGVIEDQSAQGSAADTDRFLMWRASDGELYYITKANLLAGITGLSAEPDFDDMDALSAGGHTLADADRLLPEHRGVRTASGSDDFVVMVPDGAADMDSWLIASRTSGAVYIHRPPSTLAYDGLTGTFTVGETITGGTSAATAIVVADTGSVLSLVVVAGTFQNDETITGGTSSATAAVNGTITNNAGTINGAAYQTLSFDGAEAVVKVLSNASTSPVCSIKGDTDEDTTARSDHDMDDHDILNIGAGSTFETPASTLTALGGLPLGGGTMSGNVDMDGNDLLNVGDMTCDGEVVGNGINVAVRGAGSSQPTVADSGGYYTTDGAITIPNTAIGSGWFHCTLEFGGDHNITFNSVTLDISGVGDGYVSGDVVSIVVKSGTVIRVIGKNGVTTQAAFA